MEKLAAVLGVEVFQLFVPDKANLRENAAAPASALLRLRQEIKNGFGVCINACADSHFSRFLSAGPPPAGDR